MPHMCEIDPAVLFEPFLLIRPARTLCREQTGRLSILGLPVCGLTRAGPGSHHLAFGTWPPFSRGKAVRGMLTEYVKLETEDYTKASWLVGRKERGEQEKERGCVQEIVREGDTGEKCPCKPWLVSHW